MTSYIPTTGDIIWLDFEPASGREIQKRRPALVVSRSDFNRATQFAVVCPITSSTKDLPTRVTLPKGLKTEGQVVVSQLKSLDIYSRNMAFIEKVPPYTLQLAQQIIGYIF